MFFRKKKKNCLRISDLLLYNNFYINLNEVGYYGKSSIPAEVAFILVKYKTIHET